MRLLNPVRGAGQPLYIDAPKEPTPADLPEDLMEDSLEDLLEDLLKDMPGYSKTAATVFTNEPLMMRLHLAVLAGRWADRKRL
jgi:hypothetical protein